METDSIDITPKWADIMPTLMDAYASDETPSDARHQIQLELQRMANLADRLREANAVVIQFVKVTQALAEEQNPTAARLDEPLAAAEQYFGITK